MTTRSNGKNGRPLGRCSVRLDATRKFKHTRAALSGRPDPIDRSDAPVQYSAIRYFDLALSCHTHSPITQRSGMLSLHSVLMSTLCSSWSPDVIGPALIKAVIEDAHVGRHGNVMHNNLRRAAKTWCPRYSDWTWASLLLAYSVPYTS